MDLRGQQLKDAYQNLITKSTDGDIQDGQGNDIVSSLQLGVVRMDGANLRFNGQSTLPAFYLPQVTDLVVTFIPDSDYTDTDSVGFRAVIDGVNQTSQNFSGPYTRYERKSVTLNNVPAGYCLVGTTSVATTDVNGLLEVSVKIS